MCGVQQHAGESPSPETGKSAKSQNNGDAPQPPGWKGSDGRDCKIRQCPRGRRGAHAGRCRPGRRVVHLRRRRKPRGGDPRPERCISASTRAGTGDDQHATLRGEIGTARTRRAAPPSGPAKTGESRRQKRLTRILGTCHMRSPPSLRLDGGAAARVPEQETQNSECMWTPPIENARL